MSRNQRIEIRVTETEKQSWAQAAGGTRRVSEWLRSLANAAAHDVPAGQPVPPPAAVPKTSARAAEVAKTVTCPRAHFHRPGVYCASCGS